MMLKTLQPAFFVLLKGSWGKKTLKNVISKGRLANGLAWTISIVLDVDESTAAKMKKAGKVLLQNHQGLGIAILHVKETFTFDKEKTAKGVYGTTDSSHPGVAKTMS